MIMEPHSSKTLVVTILVSLSLSLAPCLALASTSCKFPAIFNFGDSNSDTGGLSAVFGQARSPHGESYFHRPAGRYCDGRLVIDFIGNQSTDASLGNYQNVTCVHLDEHNLEATKNATVFRRIQHPLSNTIGLIELNALFSANSLGLPFLSAYLDSVGSNFSHGANFATAGSTIRPQNTTLRQSGFSPISLDVQYNEFYDFHPRSQVARNRGGVFKQLMPKTQDFSRALYTFDIGQNDLTAGLFLNMSTTQVKAYVPDVLNQFKDIVTYIYGQGGRYFWIHNTGPIGCLPYVLDRLPVLAAQVDNAGCAIPYNKVAQFFNRGLKQALVQLRKDLPLAAITYVDVYSAKYSLISQPEKHGFKEPVRACCGHGGKYNYNLHIGCGGKAKVHGKVKLVGKACQDPSLWVNWDGVHYTQAANKRVFDQIVDGSFSDPPTPLKRACQRQQAH